MCRQDDVVRLRERGDHAIPHASHPADLGGRVRGEEVLLGGGGLGDLATGEGGDAVVLAAR